MDKKRILFYNTSRGGIVYYRTITPMIELERQDDSKKFHVEFLSELNFSKPETLDYLKSFDIIHYHKYLTPDIQTAIYITGELKSAGVKLVLDIDDYWHLHKNHPLYGLVKENNHHETILFNLNLADYITTTTEIFAEEIKGVTKKDNVVVLYNSVNPEWMDQFKNNWKEDPNGLVRITYMGGSSHLKDLEQLDGVVNVLNADIHTRNKFKIILAGWDSGGYITKTILNTELQKELLGLKLWTQKTVQEINKSKGNIDLVKSIPQHLKDRFRNNMFIKDKREIETKESAYYGYEKILTNNYSIIKDKSYYRWLMNFEINGIYSGNEGNFGRRWTQKENQYAKVLDETDIVLAPLEDIKFNNFKSNLKQVECWTRKLPVICSDMPPYNIYGKDMENCLLIPPKKNAKKYWIKALKKLISDKNLRIRIGEGLHDTFMEKFNLKNVTKTRIEFYEKIINEKGE